MYNVLRECKEEVAQDRRVCTFVEFCWCCRKCEGIARRVLYVALIDFVIDTSGIKYFQPMRVQLLLAAQTAAKCFWEIDKLQARISFVYISLTI